MKVGISSIETVEEFKYLGTTLTNQSSIQEEITSRLKLGNACYHSVQNLLSSSLLYKNLKIKVYRTIILPVVLYGCVRVAHYFREPRIPYVLILATHLRNLVTFKHTKLFFLLCISDFI